MSYDSVRGRLTQAWEALSPGQQWVHSIRSARNQLFVMFGPFMPYVAAFD